MGFPERMRTFSFRTKAQGLTSVLRTKHLEGESRERFRLLQLALVSLSLTLEPLGNLEGRGSSSLLSPLWLLSTPSSLLTEFPATIRSIVSCLEVGVFQTGRYSRGALKCQIFNIVGFLPLTPRSS